MNSKNTMLKRKSFQYVALCSLKQQMQNQQFYLLSHTVLDPVCTSIKKTMLRKVLPERNSTIGVSLLPRTFVGKKVSYLSYPTEWVILRVILL